MGIKMALHLAVLVGWPYVHRKRTSSLAEAGMDGTPEGVSGLALELNSADVTICQGKPFTYRPIINAAARPKQPWKMACCTCATRRARASALTFLSGFPQGKHLTIELPEGALKALDIRLGAGICRWKASIWKRSPSKWTWARCAERRKRREPICPMQSGRFPWRAANSTRRNSP